MGAYLSTPVREKISDDKSTDKLIYGVSSMQGWRISQEDAHNCNPEFDSDLETSFFAIYDGHGGAEVAQYASKNLPGFLKKMPAYKDNLAQALEKAFLQFDETIIHEDVLKELKAMAGVESDGEAEQDDEEEKEAAMLFEEADMPLEKLLERYTSSGRQLSKLRQSAKLHSPVIRAKKESAEGSEQRTNSGDGDVKLKLDSELLVNGKNGKMEDSEIKPADSGIVVDNSNSTDMLDSAQKSDSVTTSKEAEAVSVDCNSTTSNNGCAQSGQASQDMPAAQPSSPSAVSSTTSVEGAAGSSSSKSPDCGNPEPGSSLGKKASKRKNVIPAEGEDESSGSEESTDEDEWHSSEDEALDGEGEPDSEDDDEEEDDEDEGAMMGGTGEPGFDSGCTAVVAVLRGKQLYVANAGDSRCVVCRDGKAVDMSIDHKPEDEPEQKRINNAGGKVTFDGRVNGGLNLSRALGDHCYKKNEELGMREQMITALPDVKSITLDDKDEFMVLACDGIWNVMSSQDVVNTVRERLQSHVTKLSSICEELFGMCLAPDTTGDGTGCDNMTCMIIDFSKLHGGDIGAEKTATGKRRVEDPSGTDGTGQPDCKKTKTSDVADSSWNN